MWRRIRSPRTSSHQNVLLYYIGTFKHAGTNGIRFEHGAGLLPASGGAAYQFGYRYALAPRSESFGHWQPGRALASFDWTDLGAFACEKKLASVWLALARGGVQVFRHAEPDAPFAVRVEVSPPDGYKPVWGGLLKGIFDGVISALQAHTDISSLDEVSRRLATMLPADATEIAGHLVDQQRAVLGTVPRLVTPYRNGVKWDPSDHLCVAGEFLAAAPVHDTDNDGWAIRGEVFEVTRL